MGLDPGFPDPREEASEQSPSATALQYPALTPESEWQELGSSGALVAGAELREAAFS